MADTFDTPALSRRLAALDAMHRFHFEQGIAVPSVREEMRDDAICFIGTAPDGREYAVGYIPGEGEQPSSEPFPAPPARFRVAA